MITMRKASMMRVWSIPWVMFLRGSDQSATQSREKAADNEHEGKHPVTLIPTAPTMSRSTAAAREILPILVLFVRKPEAESNQWTDNRKEQVVSRERQVENQEGTFKHTGSGQRTVIRAPDHLYQVSEE